MLSFLKSKKKKIEGQFVLFGAGLPFLFLAPFAIYRLINGDLMIAAFDAVMSLFMAAIFIQSWRRKDITILKYIGVISFMVGFLGVIYLKGPTMIYWAFPAMGGAYFLLKSTHAFIANISFLVLIVLFFLDKLTKAEIMSVYPSLILVCFFGFIFSMRSESQNKKLIKLVSEDTLTGIKNRRSFDEKVDEMLANYKRSSVPVSMLLLDLDYFKKINDTYGHKQGDQVLIDFAKTVKSIIRTTDYIYRFGGEEFVVIANNSSLQNSGKLANSIREFIQTSPNLYKFDVTVSIGVSEIVDNDDANSWFLRADRALYESKSAGRNRVRLGMLDEEKEICCKELAHFWQIKPFKPEGNSLMRPQGYRNNSNLVDGNNQQTNTSVNLLNKAQQLS